MLLRRFGLILLACSLVVGCPDPEDDGGAPSQGTDNAATDQAGTDAATDSSQGTQGTDPATTDSESTDPSSTDPEVDPDDTELRVTSVDPGVGQAKGGDVVTVMGNAFVDGNMSVVFGASLGFDVFVISSTRLTVTTPPGNPGLVDVTVANSDTEQQATLPFAYRYQSDVLIISVDPPSGALHGGEPVTLSGTGFSQGEAKVLFGDKKAIGVQVVDDSTLHATTPAGVAPGNVDVHVTNDQGSAVLKDGFLYYEVPRLDTVTPAAGPVAGGNEVTLAGAGFEPDTVVRFGETLATKTSAIDHSSMIAVVPEGVAGPVDVTIETEHGFGGLPNGYHYLDTEPETGVTIITVQPATGGIDGGEKVQVTVYGLTDSDDTTITFGGTKGAILSVDPGTLTAVVSTPSADAGTVDVTVTNSNGTDTLEGGYTYAKGLKVLTVNPISGPAEGGTPITVYGQGFEKGAVVRIGALPCAGVDVVNDKTIECTTPPGSPGGADVVVKQQDDKGVLPAGFFYESGTTELYVVDPDQGSQAGGTFVRLVGSGFEEPVTVTFGGSNATHVTVVNSTLITCKTPPGEIGPVDVAVQTQDAEATLYDSFTYFDPMALYGGTWGPTVEGSVNITVLEGGSGAPIPDAFTMLYVDPDTPYQGFTNTDGQITFSGPDVLGEQMVSASKDGYASNSVIAFNATNLTIYLTPTPPPSMGPPPPGASVSGKVHGLGKYVVAPPGNCASMPQTNGQCVPCTVDDECTGVTSACSLIGSTGTFCTKSCFVDAECDQGFSCLNVGGKDTAQCIPSPGIKQARCFTSFGSIFSPLPDDETPNIVKADGTYQLGSRLGELAIICLGGVVAWNDPENFTAYAFGVKRHIFVQPGANPDNDVTLNHPLTRTIKIRLDEPPFDSVNGPNFIGALAFWDLGSDGIFYHRTFQDVAYGSSNEALQILRQPSAFTGDVYDATFTLLGIALTFAGEADGQLPASYTLLTNLKDIESGNVFELGAGMWESQDAGLTQSVAALWGFDDDNVWGVGPGGAIVHHSGIGWGPQATPTGVDLYGIWGAAADDIWAVGDEATILHFDGATWQAVESVPGGNQYTTFRSVWGTSATDVYVAAASYAGIWHWDGTAWSKLPSVPGADLQDIHGAGPDAIWAVGRYGAIRYWNGTQWTSQTSGSSKDLHSIHAVSADEAYAVGADGALIEWNGTAWSVMPSPTKRTLRAVWAAGPQDVYAVGDASTLMHYDGIEWAEQTLTSKISYNALLALWGNPETSVGYALGTSEVLMGPMLQVPEQQKPEDGGLMADDYHIGFDVKPGVPAHFNFLTVAIPGLFGDTVVWSITTDGDIFDFDLPDFENIEGTPGIADGFYKLTIMRIYKDNFDIDNYDFSDFATTSWRSWAVDVTFFNK